MVRCARCGSDWVPVPVAPDPDARPEADAPEPPLAPAEPEAPQPEAPEPEPPQPAATVKPSAMARLAAQAETPRPSTALRLAWVGSIVLLILLAAVAFAWRSQIVAAWPPSARAYAAFGLHPHADASQ